MSGWWLTCCLAPGNSLSLPHSLPLLSLPETRFLFLLILCAHQPRLPLYCLAIGPSAFYQTNQVPEAGKATHFYIVAQMPHKQMQHPFTQLKYYSAACKTGNSNSVLLRYANFYSHTN